MSRVEAKLVLPKSSQNSFKNFYIRYFESAKYIVEDLFSDREVVERVKRFDKALAVRAIRSCNTAKCLLILLGYDLLDIDINNHQVQESLFKELFNGLSIGEAFLNFAFKVL